MIVTQTPLRISFLGGGADFCSFYEREECRVYIPGGTQGGRR